MSTNPTNQSHKKVDDETVAHKMQVVSAKDNSVVEKNIPKSAWQCACQFLFGEELNNINSTNSSSATSDIKNYIQTQLTKLLTIVQSGCCSLAGQGNQCGHCQASLDVLRISRILIVCLHILPLELSEIKTLQKLHDMVSSSIIELIFDSDGAFIPKSILPDEITNLLLKVSGSTTSTSSSKLRPLSQWGEDTARLLQQQPISTQWCIRVKLLMDMGYRVIITDINDIGNFSIEEMAVVCEDVRKQFELCQEEEEDNENGLDSTLLTLYQSDLGKSILSYASGHDLCTLDALNKQFKSLTTEQWQVVTKERFGMNNGKEGWKMGTSFLRPPIFKTLSDEVDTGSPETAANENIIVAVSSKYKGLDVFDASNMTHTEHRSCEHDAWCVSICGKVGSEIIVTSNGNEICAKRGDTVQRWSYNNENLSGIQSIGSETHFVLVFEGQVQLYEVNNTVKGSDGTINPLLLRSIKKVDEGPVNFDGLIEEAISWGSPNKTHFIVGYPYKIYVWKIETEPSKLSLERVIDTSDMGLQNMGLQINNVALADDYIVASTHNDRKRKRVCIWDRHTGERITYCKPGPWNREYSAKITKHQLCEPTKTDNDVYEYFDDNYIHPLALSCHGNILITSRHYESTMCIWDMKTGELLKRHNDVEERLELDKPKDCADLVYMKHMNGFLCLRGLMNVWVFPTNQRQYDVAWSIKPVPELNEREYASESEYETASDEEADITHF